MDLKLNREAIPAAESVYDGVQEQGVELDYILPDYYPDIFRLVRCEVEPSVTYYDFSGGRLTYELRCDIRILYCGESGDDQLLQCVTQQQTFTRTAEPERPCTGDPEIRLSAKTGRVSFRAVNKRRLDIRAAVSVKIGILCDRTQEVISDAFGMNVQLKKTPLRYASAKLRTDKTIQVSGEAELSSAQPEALAVVLRRCDPGDCELKLISGKLLARGEALIRLLYSCRREGEAALETMSFTIPYSQIIDLDGVDESFTCTVTPQVVSCDVTPSPDRNGQNRILQCDLELRLMCRAVKTSTVMTAEDAFSTVYPCEVTVSEILAEQPPSVHTVSFRRTARLGEGDSVPGTIYAVWCTPRNINTRISPDGSSAVISGMLTYSMAARDSSGMIVMPDREEAFEETVSMGDGAAPGASAFAEITVPEVSYNISPEGVLTAKADITAKINTGAAEKHSALTDISVDGDVKKQRDGDYAVKLYFGEDNEEIWDIAKRCSTSVAAVMEENDLTGDRLSQGGMLLIPIKE